eukprot:TRINITY_DN866_c0_g2_i1.p1 TRINITY_DN866_c0_g2~~TRINITY_DN866_c0_g2_i1.p1  ORF type:complete len:683 (+),score=196.34 TRINITY_DN866_c0_g2_i1:75-2123(+)
MDDCCAQGTCGGGGHSHGDEFDDALMDLDPVELPEGVTKEILKVAPEGNYRQPKRGDQVSVHYTGTLLSDGSKFDSSRDRGQPIQFTLGKGEVIKGWDLGVATMKKGEQAKLTLAPEFAYGEAGSPPAIPENATLVFDVELVSFVSNDDLFGDEGCIREEGSPGSGWKKPNVGDEVLLSYKVILGDGTVKAEKSNLDYLLGSVAAGEVGKVIDKALVDMKKGSTCTLACKAEYLYADGKDGKIELELHEIYETDDVSLAKDKSIMKKKVKEGEGWETPKDTSKVVLKVVSVTAAGNAVSSFTGDVETTLGDGTLCEALECGCLEMSAGEEAVLTCASAADVAGGLTKLPADLATPVLIRVQMTSFEKAKNSWDMTEEEKLSFAGSRKDIGAALFKAGRTRMALERYKGVVKLFDYIDNFKDESLKAKAVELKRTCELNKAMCSLKLGDSEAAKASCTTVLKDDPRNVKALFRRATALKDHKEYVDAMTDLKHLLEEDKDNKAAQQLMKECEHLQKQVDKKSKNMYANMCKGLGKLRPAAAYVDPVRPEEEGEKFLAANKDKEGVVVLPSGMQYKVLKKGEGKAHPTKDSPCECHYTGTLIDGTKFDSSYDRGAPATFAPNQVIKGWTEAMQLMVEGDKWQMFIPSELAYGESGSGEKIPGGSTLIFEMELLKIKGDSVPLAE